MLRALPKKFSKKKLKYTDADFVQNCLGIPKIYGACLSDVSSNGNYFLKLALFVFTTYNTELSRRI